MPLPTDVEKYISKYFIPGWEIICSPADIDTVVVIPAIKEFSEIQSLIKSLLSIDQTYLPTTLFLFVINNTLNADDEIKCNNSDSLKYLTTFIDKNDSGLNVGVIDAASPGKELNNKDGGVGLARKIGMDLALKIFNNNSPVKKLLICLDADCTVSTNYLTGIRNQFNNSTEAASIYFEHPSPLTDSIICYETFLRYYIISLRYARSKYAFHTIGSSMACTAGTYIKTGGMNKKKAAEDFYFLEKLSKFTPVKTIQDVTVYPSSRGSWRVPFGTGQRVTRFDAGTHDEFVLYNPDSFEILKEWLLLLNELPKSLPSDILKRSGSIHPSLMEFLIINNFQKDWDNIFRTSRSGKQINSQIDLWFDGFRTLKLIHYLRDNGFPNIFMFTALDTLFDKLPDVSFSKSGGVLPDYDHRMQYLSILRNLDKMKHS